MGTSSVNPASKPRAEHRLPAAIATAFAIAIYWLNPSEVQPLAVRIPVVIVAGVLLVVVIAVNPLHMRQEKPWTRVAALSLAVVLVVSNLISLVVVVAILVTGGASDGKQILLAAAQVWVANLISFAVLYWELDRGGPVKRRHARRSELPPADFRFPQDEDAGTVYEVREQSSEVSDWRPGFVDYLYESAVCGMAFSPGVGMPLRARTKLLLMAEAAGGFVLLVLVIAHAVGQLGG